MLKKFYLGRARPLSWSVLALLLAGCALPRPEGRAYLSAGGRVAQAELGYGPAALDRAVTVFRAPAAGAAGLSPGAGSPFGRSGAPVTEPSLRTDLDYRAITGQEAALSLGVTKPFTQGWTARLALRAGQGQVRYVIPAGQLRIPVGGVAVTIGEPTALHAKARFAEAELLALRRVSLPIPGQVVLGAGAGLRVTHSRLKVTSPLIALTSSHHQLQPYGVLQARYRPPRLPADVFVEGRIHGRRAAGLRAGLNLVWPKHTN